MGETVATGEGPVLFSTSITVGADLVTRLTHAQFLRGRLGLVNLVLRLCVVGVVLVGGVVLAFTSSLGWQSLLIAIGVAVILLLPRALTYVVLRRSNRRQWSVGSTLELQVRDSALTFRRADVAVERFYRGMDRFQELGTFMLLRDRITWATTLIPAELFTDESREFVHSRVYPAVVTPDE